MTDKGDKNTLRGQTIILMKFELEKKKTYPDLADMFLLERFNIGIISLFSENERKLSIDQAVKDWTELSRPYF